MQTQVNPALAQVLGAFNAISPVTPEGTPTVAAQVMQAAQQATLPQIAHQAGLGAQIQNMQQQQAQQALMQQAMAQRPPAGIEGLSPQMGNFAEGGIVGYNGEDESVAVDPGSEGGGSLYDLSRDPLLRMIRENMPGLPEDSRLRQLLNKLPESSRLRQVIDRKREAPPELAVPEVPLPQVDIPIPDVRIEGAAPSGGAPARSGIGALMGPPVPSAYERLYGQALAAHRASQERSVSPEAVGAEVKGMTAQQRQFLIDQGIDPDFLKKGAEEATRRGEERAAYYQRRADETMAERKQQGIVDFLLGARGFRGQGLGAVLGSGAAAARAGDVAAQQAAESLLEKRLLAQDAAAKDRMLLDKARHEIATGQFDSARKTLEEREKSRQQYQMREANMLAGQAKEMAELERHEADRRLRERELASRASSEKRMQLSALTTQQSTLVQQINRLQSEIARTTMPAQKAPMQQELAELTADLAEVRKQLRAASGMPEKSSTSTGTAAQGKVLNWADIGTNK